MIDKQSEAIVSIGGLLTIEQLVIRRPLGRRVLWGQCSPGILTGSTFSIHGSSVSTRGAEEAASLGKLRAQRLEGRLTSVVPFSGTFSLGAGDQLMTRFFLGPIWLRMDIPRCALLPSLYGTSFRWSSSPSDAPTPCRDKKQKTGGKVPPTERVFFSDADRPPAPLLSVKRKAHNGVCGLYFL